MKQVVCYLTEAKSFSERLQQACPIIESVYKKQPHGHTLVLAPQQLPIADEQLWQFDPTSFLAHGLAGEPGSDCLCLASRDHVPTTGCCVFWLDQAMPEEQQITGYDYLYEILSTEASVLARSRERYRWYKSQGWPVNIVDLKHRG